MPVGLYTRKGANGRRMYFRDGKLISKKSYDASRKRRGRSTRKGMRRKTARRAYTGKRSRRNNMARRKPAMPHPSITGMAAGLSVAQYLNQGTSKAFGKGVIDDVLGGDLSDGFRALTDNAVDLATSPSGKAVLSSAIVLATAGGLARKWFPSVKLGGTKLYFKI